jgi:hypothetical protein
MTCVTLLPTKMCIRRLIQYACGHAEKEFINRHCQCALVVGPVVEKRWRCARGECCGGVGDVGGEVVGEEWRRESEARRDGLAVVVEAMEEAQEKKTKAGM